MANSVTARFNDDCKVFVSMSDDTTVEKAVIIDAEGNETDIGGGGSSDFSTAKVTVILTENSTTNFDAMNIIEVGENAGDLYEDTIGSTAGVYDIVLYKGLFELSTNTDTFVSVSGNATYKVNEEDVTISVTGDCIITINREQMG